MADALAKLRDRRVKTLVAHLPPERSCAGCDLCCTAVGVRELGKPPAVACDHLCGDPGASCGIYERRPRTCREFYCLWRVLREVPEDFRPADSGFVIALNDAKAHPMVVTVHPDPARPDAWDTLRARKLFHAIADQWNCIVAIGQGTLAHTIFGPQGYVFTKEGAPELFQGETVGAPDFIFRGGLQPTFPAVASTGKITGNRWGFE